MTKYELTIMTDYVGHWGCWEAIREILQNGIDFGNPIVETVDKGIIITSKNITLEPKSLLLGHTTKKNDDSKIGNFGEGYKLCCLVLCRLGIKVIIHNGNKDWIPKLEHSEKYGCEILVIEEEEGDYLNEDLTFSIQTNFDFTDKYLPDMEKNAILDDRPGQIYVAGLYVTTLKDYKFGYNFAPDKIKLGRDRQMVSSWDIEYEMGKMWDVSDRADEVYDMMEEEAPDVSGVEYYNYHIGGAITKIYEHKYGDTVPVTTQQDIEALGGEKYQVVPSSLSRLIKKFKTFIVRVLTTPVQRLSKWEKRWGASLPEEALRELDSILEQMGKKNEDDCPI